MSEELDEVEVEVGDIGVEFEVNLETVEQNLGESVSVEIEEEEE